MANMARFTPFRDLDRFFEDDLFLPIMGRAQSPAVDLYETDNEIVAEISIPGLDPTNVNVEIENNILHIRGQQDEQVIEDKDRDYYRKEVRRGSFSRSIALPTEVDTDKVSATSEKGVLKVVMPKSERVKPKKVTINLKD